MRPLIMIVAFTLLAGAGLAVLGQGNSTTYTSSVIGNEMNPGTPNVVVLNGEAKENLAGVYHISIHFNAETKEITGGDWVRTVFQLEPGGSQTEVGTLHGNVTGGTVTLNEAGRVIAINAATLAIAGGNKDYGEVANGSGMFEGSVQVEGGPPAPQHAPPSATEGAQTPVASPPSSAPSDPGLVRPAFNGTMTLKF